MSPLNATIVYTNVATCGDFVVFFEYVWEARSAISPDCVWNGRTEDEFEKNGVWGNVWGWPDCHSAHEKKAQAILHWKCDPENEACMAWVERERSARYGSLFYELNECYSI